MFLCKFSIHVSYHSLLCFGASQMVQWEGNEDSISESRRAPAEGNGNPLQYACLENPKDREAWWATVRGVTGVGRNSVAKTPPPAALLHCLKPLEQCWLRNVEKRHTCLISSLRRRIFFSIVMYDLSYSILLFFGRCSYQFEDVPFYF